MSRSANAPKGRTAPWRILRALAFGAALAVAPATVAPAAVAQPSPPPRLTLETAQPLPVPPRPELRTPKRAKAPPRFVLPQVLEAPPLPEMSVAASPAPPPPRRRRSAAPCAVVPARRVRHRR